jgi:hypothetical protein
VEAIGLGLKRQSIGPRSGPLPAAPRKKKRSGGGGGRAGPDPLPDGHGRAVPRRLHVHIGTHKTGTTSIQLFLHDHRQRLRASGIYVPTTGRVGPGHHNLAWEPRRDVRFDPGRGSLGELIAELRGVKERVAVISSEDFEYLVRWPRLLRKFHRTLMRAGWAPHYVAFFRRPERYAPSLYGELQKHGLTMSYARFLMKIVRDGSFTFHKDWYFCFDRKEFIAEWKRSTGCSPLCLDYDETIGGEGVVSIFCRMIGASEDVIEKAKSAPRLNPVRARIGRFSRVVGGWVLRLRFRDRRRGDDRRPASEPLSGRPIGRRQSIP